MTMPTRRVVLVSLTVLCALPILSACSGAKEQLGLTRSSPDEFAVVRRAPLEVPPQFTLRPPAPGAERPQEEPAKVQASGAVLGSEYQSRRQTGVSDGEMNFMLDAGVRYNPDIRTILDEELARTAEREQPVAKRLLNIGGNQLPPAEVVDPHAETERLRTGQ